MRTFIGFLHIRFALVALGLVCISALAHADEWRIELSHQGVVVGDELLLEEADSIVVVDGYDSTVVAIELIQRLEFKPNTSRVVGSLVGTGVGISAAAFLVLRHGWDSGPGHGGLTSGVVFPIAGLLFGAVGYISGGAIGAQVGPTFVYDVTVLSVAERRARIKEIINRHR